ncbi:UPF0262 family protein [Aureimonas phyllosphaerae]|uniref:UPF0262 protein GGR05_003574 n=1 Tax=Aureimonas phyllosphaerae TaxID=1166078 RepID=A0A7W6BYD1_9HYPH|nr:UPF0262 family protein [Aureimonas phyllosphaerae]MBB3937408.1 uncharacterized protein (UPF0262 family) [Aureimonas phyllosphaerae]MBB3961526.1 uncharacterized protein (UPF0262 family) [Aureimonas phyllosphaerae]SFF39033.1 Uncharacterized protein, UPF0262 family [Aureimonas phyllosphaerae]
MAGKLISVDLDETVGRASADIEHERAVAIFDLIEENLFEPEGVSGERFRLKLALADRRLVFDIADEAGTPLTAHHLSLTPFKRVIRDYFLICDSYYEAIRSSTPSQIEAIDMGRRGIHNDGSDLLRERLAGKITLDKDTARRLFTLICVLHRRN